MVPDAQLENAVQQGEVRGPPTPQRPFQFGLRAMFIGVAVVSVVFAVMGAVGPAGSAFLAWFLLLLTAHVMGNAWGSKKTHQRVEDDGDLCGALAQLQGTAGSDRMSSDLAHRLNAGRGTRLRESKHLGWPMIASAAGGVIIGGALGATLLSLSLGPAGLTGVIVGSLSSAVVGGFLGFLTSSFLGVALNAWQEAAGEPASLTCDVPRRA
jgi:hypothetical protein